MAYRITVKNGRGEWIDSGGGIFDSHDDAFYFADSEIGVEYRIGEVSYTIASCKTPDETCTGDANEAIDRAEAIAIEFVPAWGVQVTNEIGEQIHDTYDEYREDVYDY